MDEQRKIGGNLRENTTRYKVDGEIGRVEFKTHSLISENGEKIIFNTAKDIFRTLMSKEWYRTECFNEIVLDLVTDTTYRKAADRLNRIRWQENGGTPAKTLANIVEIEGKKIQRYISELADEILTKNNFCTEGMPNNELIKYGADEIAASIDKDLINTAIEQYNADKDNNLKIDLSEINSFIEAPEKTVNISFDDVSVKKQKENRNDEVKKEKREYVRNTIVHIEKEKNKYLLNAESTVLMIPILIAFLLHNSLLNNYIQFFVDGERSLHNSILAKFKWFKSFRLILDWYHLKEKCEMELSLGLKGRKHRSSVLDEILPMLWLGKINTAISILQNINKDLIKSKNNIERLIKYFERNSDKIPCYALRKELGLRNSSNKGEKANDIIVAERQKHNGMSWSKKGSVALATITTLHKNKEQKDWYIKENIKFKLVS